MALNHQGSRRQWRWNALLSALLAVTIAVLANVITARHTNVRVDLSADGLGTLSDATRSIVERVEDQVTVRLFATEDVRDGQLALRAAQVTGQLEEILGLRREIFELQILDPSRSSEARRRAVETGLRPTRGAASGLDRSGGDEVWYGLTLGYRGRSATIADPMPWRFEVQFASALHAVIADRIIGVGWVGAAIDPVEGADAPEAFSSYASSFRSIRAAFSQRSRFEQIVGLETGREVPGTVDVLFVVRPDDLHPRAVYAIDQFVQRGGRLVVCLDDPDYNVVLGRAQFAAGDFAASPMGSMLRSWGIAVPDSHVWDESGKTLRHAVTSVGGQAKPLPIVSPLVVTVPPEGLESSLAPTRGVNGVQFAWAHPIVPEEVLAPPSGVVRTDLAWSSENSKLDSVAPELLSSPQALRSRRAALRSRKPRSHVLAAVFGGRFPSPWEGKRPPEPLDPLGLGSEIEDDPAPRSRENSSQVVVFGDADWLRDPWQFDPSAFSAGGGRVLALNLVDWLTLDEELIGLRSRAPSLRPLRDLVEEEMEALGAFEEDGFQTEAERIERSRNLDLANSRATRRQWVTMLAPAGGALLIVLLFGVLWNRPRGGQRGGVHGLTSDRSQGSDKS